MWNFRSSEGNMTAKPLFHQQFYRAYFLLFLSLTFLLAAIFGLVTVREHDFDLQINAQLPQLEKNQQQLLSLKKAQSHINILSSSLTGDDLIEQHNQLEISLERVLANHSQLVLPNFVYLSKKNDAEKIIRLAGQDTINRRLITEVEEQLIQVLVPFKRLIELKQKRAEELFNLIKNDSVSGGATLSRAKAHAKLIMSISDERLAYEQLLQLIAQIPLLNLQSEEKLLENISQTANDFIGWFETAGNSIANEDPVLFKQMSSWKSLLINEDKFIDKWRVHAQRYDDYRSLLKQQQRYLSELANDIEKAKNKVASPLSVDELLPVWLQENLKRANIILDHQSLHFILLITIMLSLTMFLLVILNLNKRLQESSYHNVKLIESVLHQREYEQSTYIEQDKIIALLNVIKHPPENQIDIDALINLHKVSINNIATFHRVISWDQTDVQSYQRLNALFSNLFHLPNSKSFRANFTAESFQLLVQSARLAKETGKLIDCTLEAMLGNKYVCTLNFAGGFYGTVSPLHVDEEIIDIDADENLTQTLVELNENNANEKTEIALALTDKVVKANV